MDDIRNITNPELQQFLLSINEKPFRIKQINTWLWKKNVHSFEQMSNLSLQLRNALKAHFTFKSIKIKEELASTDQTRKFIFKLHDDSTVEGVLIPSNDRVTACLSSQIGCALECTFCATGTMGFTRNLEFWEILDQYILMNQRSITIFGHSISHIVLMGMGEPLLNYANVMHFIQMLTVPAGNGLSPARITLSTVGIPPQIKQLADDGFKSGLALSLHSANNNTRNKIIPIAKKYSLTELQEALIYFVTKTKSRITIEYLLLNNINDSIEDAEKLCRFCKAFPVKINIIEYNPTRSSFTPSVASRRDDFIEYLKSKNLLVYIRNSRGKDIDAACGQLVKESKEV